MLPNRVRNSLGKDSFVLTQAGTRYENDEIEAVEINDPMAFDGGGETATAARILF
jgi:hypothetical protein